MSEYDTWAPVYDAWAADMTEDGEHYVSLARSLTGSGASPSETSPSSSSTSPGDSGRRLDGAHKAEMPA